MAPVSTDSLLTDWRMTGVVVIAKADRGREYVYSRVFSLSKKKTWVFLLTSVHHFYSISRLFRQVLPYTVRYLTSLDMDKCVVSFHRTYDNLVQLFCETQCF